MLHIKSLIIKKLGHWQEYKDTDNNTVCREAEEILKQKSTDAIEVLFYKNQTIYIKCPNSVVANELRLKQEEIKGELNKVFKKDVVKKITIKI